jgi:hypothetical protein
MFMPEWMERVFASVVRTHPPGHGRQREIGDAHRLLLMRFGKNPFALRRRQHVEQLGRRDYVHVQVELLAFE